MAYAPTYVAASAPIERLTLFSSDFKSQLIMVGAFMFIAYIFLWFYNTEAAIRVTIAVFNGIGKAIIAIFKGLYSAISAISRWISR